MRIVAHEQGAPGWHAWRAAGIGASDAAALLGISPYVTRAQLLEEKRGRSERSENPAMARGKALEPVARARYEERTGEIIAPVCVEFEADPRLRASLDGMPLSEDRVIEIKCPTAEEHEAALAGTVPQHYYIQVQHQLLCTGLRDADYVSFHPDYGMDELAIVHVRAEPSLQQRIRAAAEQFLAELAEAPAPSPLELIAAGHEPTRVNLLRTEAERARDHAATLVIATEGDYQHAAGWVQTISTKRKEIEGERRHLLEPIEEAKRRVNDWLKPVVDTLDLAERDLKGGMLRYQQRQQLLRDEETARIRQEAEARRRAAEEASRAAADKAQAEAAQAEASGDFAAAGNAQLRAGQALRELSLAQSSVPAIVPVTVVPTAKGVSTRQTWSAEVVDLPALLAAVAQNPGALGGLVNVNQQALNALARAQKGAFSVPGCRAVPAQSIAVRGAA